MITVCSPSAEFSSFSQSGSPLTVKEISSTDLFYEHIPSIQIFSSLYVFNNIPSIFLEFVIC